MLFVTSLHNRISYKTMKVYLAGIEYASRGRGGGGGGSHTLANTQLLQYTLWGIRILQGDRFKRHVRGLVTISHLHKLHAYFDREFITQDANILKAATLLAFFGLLRASEYLSDAPHSSHHDSPLPTSDIRISTDHLHTKVSIRKSKTDSFRHGCTITIWATPTALCPIQAMERFLSKYCYTQGPLFRLSNGSLLSRRRLSGYLQAALPSLNLNTHSFRIGGASAAAAMGIPDSTIQILGRWASNAYRTYPRLPDSTIQHACVQMAQSSPHPRTYLPHDHTNLEEHEGSVRE